MGRRHIQVPATSLEVWQGKKDHGAGKFHYLIIIDLLFIVIIIISQFDTNVHVSV